MADDVLHLPDGRGVQWWSGGAPEGPVVVVLHGCPDTRHVAMTGQGTAQRVGVRLVALNRPGYGRSDRAPTSHGSVADDVAAALDRLGHRHFAVLGMSVGGQYALACAARHPERVTAAGVVAAPAVVPRLAPPVHRDDLDDEQRAFFARLAAVPVGEAVELVRPEFEAFVRRVDPADPDDDALAERWLSGLPAADAALLAHLPAAEVAASAREALVPTDGYLCDAALAFREWDVRPQDVRCPTVLWYGEEDDNASVRNGRWLAEHVPGARLVVRPRTTHLATLLAHWDDVLATLREMSGRG
ncbi:alpha/beta hydrolase [Angustibacter peucedani]